MIRAGPAYLEQTTIYNSMNFSLACLGQASYVEFNSNRTGVIAKLNAFLCPSSQVYTGQIYNGSASFNAPGNNYFASVGSSLNQYGVSNYAEVTVGSAPPNGVFQVFGQSIGLQSITDGSSNTIAMSEWKTGDNNNNVYSLSDMVGTTTFPGGATAGAATLNMPLGGAYITSWLQTCAQSGPGSVGSGQSSSMGSDWAEGLYGHTIGNLLIGPNAPYPNCNINANPQNDTDASFGSFGMSSYHPGGANALMADGSVRFIKNTINQLTLWGLASRAQGEVISADAY